jgi:hypothetical protein
MNDFESGTEKKPTQGYARQHIEAVRGQVMQMGGNDTENEVLNGIILKMEDGDITPLEAIDQANGTMDSKQAYH